MTQRQEERLLPQWEWDGRNLVGLGGEQCKPPRDAQGAPSWKQPSTVGQGMVLGTELSMSQ